MFCLVSLFSAALAAGVAGASGAGGPLYNGYTFHELVGVPGAARIKASEEALDFDGGRIMGGSAARLGQFPFAAGVIIHMVSGQEAFCGGSLMSNTRLTTGAHCWLVGGSPANHVTIVLGSLTLFSGGTRIVTNQVTPHPHYNPNNLNNDVAVVAITPVFFSANINRISLPAGNSQYVGVQAVAVGYGDHNNAPHNHGLRYVQLPVISNAECRQTYIAEWVPVTALCVDTRGARSTCYGDSGGALQHGDYIIGITSFVHSTGCLSGYPAGFTRVTSFVPWIRSHM